MQLKLLEKMFYLDLDDKHIFEGHSHIDGYEANIMLSGALEITCSETTIQLRAGELAIWDARMFHRNRVPEGKKAKFISLHLNIEDKLPKNFLGFYKMSPSNQSLCRILEPEINKDCLDVSRVASCLIEALLIRVEDDAHKPYISSDAASIVYRDAVDFMNTSIDSPLCLADISHNCKVCITSLKNAFAKYAGKGVIDYFLSLRMERARNLLQNGVSSKQICDIMGFSSPSYFSQSFKREYGCSVREYLKEKTSNTKRC